MFPAETYGKVWAEAAPYAAWHTIPNAGHDPDIDPSDATALIVNSVRAV